jgi:MFS family permease
MSRFVAFSHRDFRLLWAGNTFSGIGSAMQVTAISWHVFELLRGQETIVSLFGRDITLGIEALGLGGLGLARILPIIVFALFGGMLADTIDRRRLMIMAETGSMFVAGTLAVLTFSGNESIVWLYVLTATGSATRAFVNPAQQSLVPNLVPRHHLTNAISLNVLSTYGANVVGPALAGLLVSKFGLGVVYSLDTASFAAVLVGLILIRFRGQLPATGGLGWTGMKEGLRFTFGNRIIWSTMLLDFIATFFSSARTLLPIVAEDVLKVGVQGYGYLVAAQPVGAVLAGTYLSLRQDVKRQGVLLLLSVAIFGLATALFGLSTLFALSFFLFAVTGAADTLSAVIRGTIRQLTTPDELRGRMTGINMMFFMGGPQLGEVEAGIVAAALGAPFAIVSGGVITVLLTGWIAWRYPRLRRYE